MEEERFRVIKGKIPLDNGKLIDGWFIVEGVIPIYEINEWIEEKSGRKILTGKKYAYSIVKFLNYLLLRGKTYLQANRRDVIDFIDYLIYGSSEHVNYISLEGQASYSTIQGYLTVLTGFYKWLDFEGIDNDMILSKRTDYHRGRNSYKYGQVWSYEYDEIIDKKIRRMKPSREYIKWYTSEEIVALTSNFETIRDRVIFSITLEGLRIDEVLSIKLLDYDREESIIKPYRSKGKEDGRGRVVSLPEKLCVELDNYIFNERAEAETSSGKFNDSLFINLRKGERQGEALQYANYIQILKGCAKRAGLDPDKIRTHSGRSTKTMELLEHQAKYPEDNITDAIIMQIMGWTNSSSINPYKNNQDIRLAKLAADKVNRRKTDKTEESE